MLLNTYHCAQSSHSQCEELVWTCWSKLKSPAACPAVGRRIDCHIQLTKWYCAETHISVPVKIPTLYWLQTHCDQGYPHTKAVSSGAAPIKALRLLIMSNNLNGKEPLKRDTIGLQWVFSVLCRYPIFLGGAFLSNWNIHIFPPNCREILFSPVVELTYYCAYRFVMAYWLIETYKAFQNVLT